MKHCYAILYGPLLRCLGLVEWRVVKGERKEPPSDRIKVGLESYVDPDHLRVWADAPAMSI